MTRDLPHKVGEKHPTILLGYVHYQKTELSAINSLFSTKYDMILTILLFGNYAQNI
ncbi:hypothetical protein SBDP1_470043 [Syntrophobacter sp. SbD1]|nr:hypothetical protein SBDP1_470043 [Syntrophobacter sp. SbD1]